MIWFLIIYHVCDSCRACEADLNFWSWEKLSQELSKQAQSVEGAQQSAFLSLTADHSVPLRSRKLYVTKSHNIWYIGYDGGAHHIENPPQEKQSEVSVVTSIPSLPWTQVTCLVHVSEEKTIIGYDDGKVRFWSK